MPEFSGETDSTHVATLPSAIDAVRWSRQQAAPGGTVGLTVTTVFCGEGSILEILLRDAHGTVHNTLRGELRGERVTVDLAVPRAASGGLIAEVQMPNHGLSAESPVLPVTDSVRVRRPLWSQSEVHRGDVVTLSAEARGAPDGRSARVRILERDPRNGAHDPVTQLRPTVRDGAVEVQWQFEYPGDTATIIPDWEATEGYRHPEYIYRVDVSGRRADSADERRKGVLTFVDTLTCQVVDAATGGPYANLDVEVTLADGSMTTKPLDSTGTLTLDDVPPGPASLALPEVGAPCAAAADPPDRARETNARWRPDGGIESVITTGTPWRVWIVNGPTPLSA